MNLRELGYNALGWASDKLRGPLTAGTRVLAYHDVPDPALYRRQLEYLAANYTPIDLDRYVASLRDGKPLPDDAVLITFDDGDRTVLEHAAPLHRQLGIPAVLFVVTDLIGTQNPFWWKRVEHHFAGQGSSYAEARKQVTHLKTVPNAERVAYVAQLSELQYEQLTRPELLTLQECGFSIANHTATHPLIDRCTPAELGEELDRAIAFLNDLPGSYPKVFAYPNGNSSPELDVVLREKGIELAFLFDHDFTRPGQDPLHLSRIRTNTDDPLPEFKTKVNGLHPYLYQLRK